MIRLNHDNLDLLIHALDFWIQDSVLPAFPKSRISHRKANHWNTSYLCMTKEWKVKYKGNKIKAICSLIIDHYKYVMLIHNGEKTLVNNPKYLWQFYSGTCNKIEAWL